MSDYTVAFVTMCHPPHLPKLHKPGVLDGMIASHHYLFDEVVVVHQRCRGLEYAPLPKYAGIVESEDFPDILTAYGIDENDPVAEKYTHGPTAAHYWKWHCINHLIGGVVTSSDYIVFSDCDCLMIANSTSRSWVVEGIDRLKANSNILVISPNDGGQERYTRRMSQQCFLIERNRFFGIDFTLPFTGFEPGGPMAEYYFMLEGKIDRFMVANNTTRLILPQRWRYWHYNPWLED